MDDNVKKIINNGFFIAELAPLIEGPDAAALAGTARAYSAILDKFGIKVPRDGFAGCEQAQLLVEWIRIGGADTALMREWTAAILGAIDELAHGQMPKTE